MFSRKRIRNISFSDGLLNFAADHMDFRITKREIMFSVIIFFIMLFIGGFICNIIDDNITIRNQKYLSSIKINDDARQLRYGMDTNVGNAIIYGDMKAIDPVSMDDVTGEYMYIKKVKERYTPHTRTVTYTSNGKTHTRVEVYYTWDAVDSWKSAVDEVYYVGNRFKFSLFDYHDTDVLRLNNLNITDKSRWYKTDNTYLYETSSVRYYFDVIPDVVSGTTFAHLDNGTMNDVSFVANKNIDEFINSAVKDEMLYEVIFWIAWLFLTAILIFVFCIFENNWLEGD
jgi:hypothetical protein